MAVVELGVPDDTPENTVKAIMQILKQEAERRSLALNVSGETLGGIRNSVTARVGGDRNAFTISLNWVNSDDLEMARGSVGSGTIFQDWTLELLYGPKTEDLIGWKPGGRPEPPFRWGLYPRNADNYLRQPPKGILDGTLLRKLLSESLPFLDR